MKGWRLFAVGLGTAVFNFLAAFDFASMDLSAQTIAYINTGVGVAVMVLRAVTTTPIGKKE